jgi:hypothetical protein
MLATKRNPGQIEVRRVTTVSTQKVPRPERSSHSGALSKVFTGVKCFINWACRSSGYLLLPDQGEASPTRPATSFGLQIPANSERKKGRVSATPWLRLWVGVTADRFAVTINPVHTMSDGDKIFASSKDKASLVPIDASALALLPRP